VIIVLGNLSERIGQADTIPFLLRASASQSVQVHAGLNFGYQPRAQYIYR